MLIRQRLAIAAAILLTGVSAQAVTLLDEQFDDYTADTAIIPQNTGGTGWATGSFWSSNNAQSGTSINNLIVNAAGQAEVPTSASNGGQAFRTLATPLTDTTGNTVYISYDAQAYNLNTRYFGLALNNGTNERTIIGHGSGSSQWDINNMTDGTTSGTFSSGVDATTQAHVVVKIVFGGAGNPEQVSVWINPDLGQVEGANNATLIGGTALTSTSDWGDITQVRIGSGNTSGSNTFVPHWFDNLLIATDSPFAVPEPASVGLLGLAALILSKRR